MRKIILYMQISLDGVVSDPELWMTLGDEFLQMQLSTTILWMLFLLEANPILHWQNTGKLRRCLHDPLLNALLPEELTR